MTGEGARGFWRVGVRGRHEETHCRPELRPNQTDDVGEVGMARSEYKKARRTVVVSMGESVRILRELQELSQNELAALTGIAQSTISAIENDKVRLGVERAKVIARALRVHPAVIVFPGWDVEREAADQSPIAANAISAIEPQ